MLLENQCLFLITGIMASGKSTVAQLLAERFASSVHLRGDMFRKMVIHNRKEVHPDAQEDQLNQLRLRYRLTAQAADTYYEHGFTVIMQDVVVGPLLHDFVANVRSRPLYVVVLCPNAETVEQREAERPKKGYGIWTVAALDQVLKQDTPRIGMWLDSSALTAEETVDEILKRYRNEALYNGARMD
ncbi:AAA domain-containing protein [Paenibacillus sp. UNCCL117]|uniref:AAA family ATPase n=1 Tax=unclassified Paenibacillus TaxID=185978 RepID=UPI0008817690|nr:MULTISPECIES: AAA family ATPase [unclassified Paenibacillus]SDD70998.1 AAA domain-containing protein [Paenibacillus sp. cl123]SFW45451.1 AAA domain-containing protein [Paenibacillus sp. UNCCL117]